MASGTIMKRAGEHINVIPRAAIVGLVAALALAPPAFAAKKKGGGGLKISTATAEAMASGAFQPVTATATCPKGTQVVGGGYTTGVPQMATRWINVHESQRAGATAWRVSGVEVFGGANTLTAYAYCQAKAPRIKARSATVAMPGVANSSGVVQANCPKGMKAIAGGFATAAATPTEMSLVSRSIAAGGSRWVVDATQLSGSSTPALTAQVYCAATGKVRTRFGQAAVVGPLGSQYTANTPVCAKGTAAPAGGFATSTPIGGLGNAALVFEVRRAGRFWSATAAPSSDTSSITLVSAAYCR